MQCFVTCVKGRSGHGDGDYEGAVNKLIPSHKLDIEEDPPVL